MDNNISKAEEGHGAGPDTHNSTKAHLGVTAKVSPHTGRPFAPKNVFSLVVGVIWLAPAIALLVLNFKEHIIGAGIGCDGLECRIDPYSTNQVQQIQALDEKNRDILGALQLVAKALEIWFMFIAGNLVYNIALRLARRNLLPLSLLTTYAEFLDILYLKSLVTILINIAKQRKDNIPAVPAPSHILMPNRSEHIATVINTTSVQNEESNSTDQAINPKWQRAILYLFIVLVAFLSLVANLMGTATAILVLPTLNWIDINQNDSMAFVAPKSSGPPNDGDISPGCSIEDFAQGTFSCSFSMYSASLDAFMDTALSSRNQDISRNANPVPPVITEGNVSATLNISESSPTIWVPTRQTMRELSVDLRDYYSTTSFSSDTTNDPQYPDSFRFNQALQSSLQRKGPVFGMGNDCVRDNITRSDVDDNKEVLCFPRAGDTKCIRWGSGWTDTVQVFAEFVIEDAFPAGGEAANLTVNIWETDQAAYLSHEDFERCNNDGTCDWDVLFSAPPAPENVNISRSSLTFEYSFGDAADMQILCHTAFYVSFANYVLKPSLLSNILSLVELNILDDSPSALPDDQSAILGMHPDWLLLAWSVDRTGGSVPGYRSSNTQLIEAAKSWLDGTDDSTSEEPGNRRNARTFNSLHQYSIVHALSMVPYEKSTISSPSPDLETLSYHASVQLWKYGVESRTSKLGVTIMIIGCLCVLTRLVIYYEESKSPTEIVVTALKHPVPDPNVEVNEETGHPVRVSYARRSRTLSFGPLASPVQSPPASPPISP